MASRSKDHSLSVVMPVHNALPFLDDAVRSILDQTHSDFEFVIYDDASTDGSTERLREWAAQDERIRLIEGERNLGPVGSSITAVENSTGEFVARMDADDLSHPQRLELQLGVFEANPATGLVGSMFDIIDDDGRQIRTEDHWRLERRSAFLPFAHGSIMFRRAIFAQIGGYREECIFWEDQDLVLRMAAVADVLVIPRSLYRFRQWRRQKLSGTQSERVENAVDLMYRCLARFERGETYDNLLESREGQPSRVDPRVFISAGSRILWPGGRPMLLGRLLKRGKLSLNARTASTLVWATWASVSPSSLRAFLRFLLLLRNARARHVASAQEPVQWSPAQPRSTPSKERSVPLDLVRPADSR